MPTVRLRRVRYLHSTHKEDIPRFEGDTESGQIERRAQGCYKGHDEEH
jgi:hypothetical protein